MGRRHPRGWWTVVASIAAALLVVAPASLAAQESFAYVQHILRTGDTVFVINEGGIESRGKVLDVGATALRLSVKGDEREWPAATIQRLERRGDSVKDGALVGLVAGAVFGGLMAGAVIEWSGDWGGAFLVLGAAAAEGAAIGAGIDALFPGRTLIYRQAPRQVTLAPLVSRGIRAVQLGISF